MHKYRKASGVVLKKQNYKETDQIITIYTPEFGKIRVLARGIRKPQSKLSGSLQDLCQINFEMTGKMPIVISAEVARNHKNIRTNLSKMAPAFYATELMLKTTADEEPNNQAYDLLINFLSVLDQEDDLETINIVLQSFALKLLGCLGFSTEYADQSFRIAPELALVIENLRRKELVGITSFEVPAELLYKLKNTINMLLEFVLERELKSQAFLAQVK